MFSLWQKLLAKNIPSCPWPCLADLLLYIEEQYVAVELWPFANIELLQQAWQERCLNGFVLVDPRPESPWLMPWGEKMVINGRLADRLGSRTWLWLGQPLSAWHCSLLANITGLDADGALDLIGLMRRFAAAPWPTMEGATPPLADLAPAFFDIWRAGGNPVTEQRLGRSAAAAAWLSRHSSAIAQTEAGFALRR